MYTNEEMDKWKNFISDRITYLRLEKSLSERKLSELLDKAPGYIGTISNGKNMPSMQSFLEICAYFNITPSEFFDIDLDNIYKNHEAKEKLKNLSDDDIELIINLMKRLEQNKCLNK